jgi:hypothetical protein
VRFFGGDGAELLARRDGVYAADALAERMLQALAVAERPGPRYLALAAEELARTPLERAVFAMACFWRGEGVLGSIGGVRSVRAAWLDGREVVEVAYDPGRLAFAELLTLARNEGCAERLWVERGPRLDLARERLGGAAKELTEEPRPAEASDLAHDLSAAGLAWLPLTPLQRVRVNARLSERRPFEEWLAPWQRELLERGRARVRTLGDLAPPAQPQGLWAYRAELERRLAQR